ncbi:MAG: sulfotransferase domain-containing protein [Bacteroidales bacterium]|nr:sulfotransferase domain-containing protein [Bacteroidales bacterium]MCM1146668.1 sulfotransferase domain-containing protein [Bacteroidales bacterium]MCM1206058.1 sulfotransferase domain-containing protein [Bacillota bacterium]MCM1511039.1 sulfotransferase domain-containing protein [Clostridium sp.]
MKNIRKYIRDITPYKIVADRKRISFMEMYDEWKGSGKDLRWDEECLFSRIVSVEGFGATGASAVVDLIREYDGQSVLGTVDPEGSLADPDDDAGEIDFIRLTGGLLQLSQAFDNTRPRSYYWNDAAVKQFIGLVNYSTLFLKHAALRPCFFKFLDEILALRIKDARDCPINPVMGRFYDTADIYFLKDLSLDSYRSLCRRMLNTVFNHFHNGTGTFLMLDQLFADCNADTEVFRKFVPNLKQIIVCRDPRDVYCIARRLDLQWMPHGRVEDFITWTRIMYGDFSLHSDKYLSLRFENLILDYDREVERIEKYLDLSPELHTRKRQCLNPDISVKSVRRWTREPHLGADFCKIEEAFPELCLP